MKKYEEYQEEEIEDIYVKMLTLIPPFVIAELIGAIFVRLYPKIDTKEVRLAIFKDLLNADELGGEDIDGFVSRMIPLIKKCTLSTKKSPTSTHLN